eukprot:Blabericola_migrator_1__3030@NODE_1881_length_3609_cov_112_322981_g1204_i0_p1_GENE_NODE_1881_length_3609_cov_112_322981_g1204_i0NODE_1881_length_3609_cov_112_322981_g1204_i0_p1_ORF_typecomplete_len627_score129_34ThiF/PF00899_21/8_5e56UBA_e1_thiolCys/PF10585_9/2_4e20UAE_UbL/PF14732_6/0_0001Shikimate_DH/PF01488_20/0_0042PglD_N/PF17836_1/0_55_NODE_1881_length_3609_cov_112_322981_g1204_i016963576
MTHSWWLNPNLRADKRILLVGAGGIGCEVLKNLVLCGFRKLSVIDLDSIDVSNLNRQFLFRRDDVGKSKALVATEAIRRYLEPGETLDIEVYNCKIQELGIDVISPHDIILNALDNFEARRYVNRIAVGLGKTNMSLRLSGPESIRTLTTPHTHTLDIPIIESGSTGHNGQAFPIWSAAGTECFDCRDQPVPETFPVCTVRLTPEKPEHCIAWARYLMELLYGPQEDLSSNVLMDIKDNLDATQARPEDFARSLALKLFFQDIKDLIEAKEWTATTAAPQPLNLSNMSAIADIGKGVYMKSPNSVEARSIWDTVTNLKVFLDSAAWLKANHGSECLRFEKDNDQIMAFVAAAANLRMTNYSIPNQSLWDCKSMAGSIQPAIAATNAIVAGLQVDQMLRVLKAKEDFKGQTPTKEDLHKYGVRFTWVRGTPTGNYLLVPEPLEPPKNNCFICQVKRVKLVVKSLEHWTVNDLMERVLQKSMDCQGELFLQTASSIIYDPDLAEDDPEIMTKTLAALISSGETVSVTAGGPPCTMFDMIVTEDSHSFDPKLQAADFPFHLERTSTEATAVSSKAFSKTDPAPAAVEIIVEGDEENQVCVDSSPHADQIKRKLSDADIQNPKKKQCTRL